MSTTYFAIKLEKSKGAKRKDGTYPISLQVTYNSKEVRRIRLGLSAKEEDWDSSNDCFITKKYSVFRKYNRQLLDELDKADVVMNTYFATKDFDFKEYSRLFRGWGKVEKEEVKHTVLSFFDYIISQYEKISTQRYYKDVKNSVKNFHSKDLSFEQIDKKWLKKFEEYYLAKDGCSGGGIKSYMRGIRSMIRQAIKAGQTKNYPFHSSDNPDGYSFSHLKSNYVPKVLTTSDLSNVKSESDMEDVKIALLSYYLAGANFADLVRLKKDMIQDDVLRYFRQKTGRLVVVPLSDNAMALLKSFESDSEYLLPIMPKILEETEDKRKIEGKIRYRRRRISKLLKKITGDKKMRFYNMRHTSATNMVLNGVSLEYVQQLFSHSDIKVTQVYVGSLPVDSLKKSISVL